MRVVTGFGMDNWSQPSTQSIVVLWQQDHKSWQRQVHRPVIVIQLADRVLEASISEVNSLRRQLDEVVMDIEEARTWL